MGRKVVRICNCSSRLNPEQEARECSVYHVTASTHSPNTDCFVPKSLGNECADTLVACIRVAPAQIKSKNKHCKTARKTNERQILLNIRITYDIKPSTIPLTHSMRRCQLTSVAPRSMLDCELLHMNSDICVHIHVAHDGEQCVRTTRACINMFTTNFRR